MMLYLHISIRLHGVGFKSAYGQLLVLPFCPL